MYARAQQQSTTGVIMTPMCTFCKSIGKSEREYTNHYIRKTKNPNSTIICPELLKRVCLNCPGRNHTSDRCPKRNTVEVCFSAEKKEKKNNEKKETNNRFAGLVEDDDSDDDEVKIETKVVEMALSQFSFDINTFMTLTNPVEKVNYIGEEIYIRVAGCEPQRAGKITAMMLVHLDITELLYMLDTKDLFDARVKECIDILDSSV